MKGEGKRRVRVIAADVGRQAALLKQPLKPGKIVVFAGRRESLGAQQITAGMIGDGEGVRVLAVAERELALVKHAANQFFCGLLVFV